MEEKRKATLQDLRDLYDKKAKEILKKLDGKIKEFKTFEEIYSSSFLQVYRIMNGSEVKYLKFETVFAGGDFTKQKLHTRFLIGVNKNLPKNLL